VDIQLETLQELGLMKQLLSVVKHYLKVFYFYSSQELPFNDYFQYFGPDYKLDVPSNNMENLNSREYLEKMKVKIMENLRNIPHAPSVQMQSKGFIVILVVPEDHFSSDEEEEDKDVRISRNFEETNVKKRCLINIASQRLSYQILKTRETIAETFSLLKRMIKFR
jgi:hypothetical protein